MMIALAYNEYLREPSALELWLAEKTKWQWFTRTRPWGDLRLLDAASGRELLHWDRPAHPFPDGRTLVTNEGDVVRLWDVPPRPSALVVLGAAAAWALPVAALTWWRVRRLRDASAKRH